jgi:hypothetical protein
VNSTKAIANELERIRRANGGLLRPEDVVAAARPRGSLLHGQFEWDDARAADEYRLWQARQLIRVAVTVLPQTDRPIRAYVSLRTDRTVAGGGYRSLCDVLSDGQLREQLLAEALDDLETFRTKYGRLRELAPVFAAARRVKRKACAARASA